MTRRQLDHESWDISEGSMTDLMSVSRFSLKTLICKRMKCLDEEEGSGNDSTSFMTSYVHLEKLDLSENRLRLWPYWLGKLAYLRELRLYRNQLSEVNTEILSQLGHLTVLDLGHNYLRNLPENLGYLLPNLRRLHLEENQLQFLPASLQFCDSLNYLNVCDNLFLSRNQLLLRRHQQSHHHDLVFLEPSRSFPPGTTIPSLVRIVSTFLMSQLDVPDRTPTRLPVPLKVSMNHHLFRCTYCRAYEVFDGKSCLLYQSVPWKSTLKVYYTGESMTSEPSRSALPFLHALCRSCTMRLSSNRELMLYDSSRLELTCGLDSSSNSTPHS